MLAGRDYILKRSQPQTRGTFLTNLALEGNDGRNERYDDRRDERLN